MLKHDKELWKLPRFIKDEQAVSSLCIVSNDTNQTI